MDIIMASPQKRADHDSHRDLISTWISAHAGSGKTKTLVDRLLILLLRDGDPAHILCLTFTKVAAREMTLRVFQALGYWASCPQGNLEESLTQLLGRKPSQAQQIKARKLFPKTLDAPGGLRIETIHGFCERLLRTFGTYVHVPPHFRVLDERELDDLRGQAKGDVLEQAATGSSDSRLPQALFHLMEHVGESHLSVLLDTLLENWTLFLETYGQHDDHLDALFPILSHHFNLPLDLDLKAMKDEHYSGILPIAQGEALANRLMEGSATDQKTSRRLRTWLEAGTDSERWEAYRAVFLTQNGAPRQRRALVSQKTDPELSDLLLRERDRLGVWETQKNGIRACLRTRALLVYGSAVFKRLESLKREKSALDFDDLIKRAHDLLAANDASWVLYRCDSALRHILVDEAQDTSPLQWAIIKQLTEEFTAGEGVYGEPRTVFVVGDIKQSIYGFQGADPTQFLESRIYFKERHESAHLPMAFRELTHSFRSSPSILAAVDSVFNQSEVLKAVLGDQVDGDLKHQSERSEALGCVEVWPPIRGCNRLEETSEIDNGHHALSLMSLESTPQERLGKRIAEHVLRWVTVGDPHCAMGPVPSHQILILLRSRGEAFDAVLRGLHAADVPTAGLDRLALMDHAVIRECLALAHVALLPQDDWVLASALRSSFLGWDALGLFELRQWQKGHGLGSLWEALEQKAAQEDLLAQKAVGAISLWETLAAHGAFSFFSHLFSVQLAWVLWVRDFGPEVHDVLDIFLGLAYDHDQGHIPDLSLFIESCAVWKNHQIKRDLDLDIGVRVMTIHGAKGLEASHVIVVDDGEPPQEFQRGGFLVPITLSAGAREIIMPFWGAGCGSLPGLEEACDSLQRAAFSEHMRLLYVALTRARDHLVFAPFCKRRSSRMLVEGEEETSGSWPHEASWTAYVQSGLGSEMKTINTESAKAESSQP